MEHTTEAQNVTQQQDLTFNMSDSETHIFHFTNLNNEKWELKGQSNDWGKECNV